jgi:hypothetical protein
MGKWNQEKLRLWGFEGKQYLIADVAIELRFLSPGHLGCEFVFLLVNSDLPFTDSPTFKHLMA